MKRLIELSSGLRLLIFVVIVFAACKKSEHDENNNNTTTKTKKELLMTGTWKYTDATISPAYDYYGDGAVTNIFGIMKACEKDDFEVYKTNGMWEYNEGPTKCDPSYLQVITLPWQFAANEKKLLVGSVEHTILELTDTTLILRYEFEDAGIVYTEVDSYEH